MANPHNCPKRHSSRRSPTTGTPPDIRFPCGLTLAEFAAKPREERVRIARNDLAIFSYYYLAIHFLTELGCPPCLQDVFHLLQGRLPRTNIVAWREFGKSSIISLALPIHEIAYSLSPYILIISQSFNYTDEHYQTLKRELESNERLIHDFGLFRPQIDRRLGSETGKWAIGDLVTANGIRVRVRGMHQRVRGTKDGWARPHLIIIDDPEDHTNTRTQEEMRRNVRFINSTVIGALDSRRGRVVAAGNYVTADCMIKKFRHSPHWKSLHLSCFDAQMQSLWPAKHSTQWLLDRKAYYESMDDYETFPLEYMNDETVVLARGFRDQDRRFWDGEVLVQEGYTVLHRMRTGRYADAQLTIAWEEAEAYIPVLLFGGKDIAFTDNKKSHYNADVVIARDAHGNIYVVTYREYRETVLSAIANVAIDQMERWRLEMTEVEANGAQAWVVAAIRESARYQALDKRTTLRTVEHTGDEAEKKGRILGRMQPLEAAGKVFIREEQRELAVGLRKFPRVDYDDLEDALEMAIECSYSPSEETLPEVLYRRGQPYEAHKQVLASYGGWVL